MANLLRGLRVGDSPSLASLGSPLREGAGFAGTGLCGLCALRGVSSAELGDPATCRLGQVEGANGRQVVLKFFVTSRPAFV